VGKLLGRDGEKKRGGGVGNEEEGGYVGCTRNKGSLRSGEKKVQQRGRWDNGCRKLKKASNNSWRKNIPTSGGRFDCWEEGVKLIQKTTEKKGNPWCENLGE